MTSTDRRIAHLLICVTLACLLFCGLLAASGPIADVLAWLDEPTPQADMTVAGIALVMLLVLCWWASKEGR